LGVEPGSNVTESPVMEKLVVPLLVNMMAPPSTFRDMTSAVQVDDMPDCPFQNAWAHRPAGNNEFEYRLSA